MKRLLILLTSIVSIIILISGAFFWWSKSVKPVSDDTSLQSFVIPRGYSASQISNKLVDQGLIRSPLVFKFYVQLTAKAKKVQAGEFLLSPSFSLFEIVNQLTKGPVEVWVTIPEGLRREEVVEKYIGILEKKETTADFRQEFLSLTSGKEGYLFPDTYLFPKTASASAVVRKMFSVFDNKVEAEMQEKQVVTMASIIEREAITDEERPIVAGILWKRLEEQWPLQADAAVQYAIATTACKGKTECNWWPILTKEDLELNSPYNTYKFTGLPPAPIANPGLSSIKAAANPQDSPYWFYLHDSEGKIHYAKTIEEHNENVRRFLGK